MILWWPYLQSKDAFFEVLSCLASFERVHKKSILLPLLPTSLLASEEPFIYRWFTHFAMLSTFLFLVQDKLIVPYNVLSTLFPLLLVAPCRKPYSTKQIPTSMNYLPRNFLTFCSIILHIIYVTLSPPERYPFLFEAIIMLHCFTQFIPLAIFTNVEQWTLPKPSSSADKEKKLL